MYSFSGAPFLRFSRQNGSQNGGPFFRKFAERVVLRWLKTVPLAKNLEKRGFRKGSRFGTSFGTSFGWNLSVDQTEGTLFLQSYGADGVPGGTGYDSDYPQSALLIQRGEALVDIVGWQVTVHFYNPEGGPTGGIALPSADTRVRVRLHYPDSGNMSWPPTWPATEGERDQANYLSEDITLAAGAVADNAVSSMVMSFGSETKRAPFGIRSVSVVDDTDGTRIGDSAQPAWRVELVSQLQPRPTAIAWNLE